MMSIQSITQQNRGINHHQQAKVRETPEEPSKNTANDEASETTKDTLHLSPEAFEKLRNSEQQENEKNDALPPHIQKLVEHLMALKEQLETAEAALLKLKAEKSSDQTTLEHATQRVQILNEQIFQGVSTLREALKEAGITDPSIIARVLS